MLQKNTLTDCQSDDIGFIKLDKNNYIPNISYENPFWHLKWQIHFLTNQLPVWLMIIWVLLYIIPVKNFPQKIPLQSKSPEKVKLEEMLDKIYELELTNKINQAKIDKQKAEDKLTKLEDCINKIATANPQITKDEIQTQLKSCL